MAVARVVVALSVSMPMQWQHLQSVDSFALALSPSLYAAPIACSAVRRTPVLAPLFARPRRMRGGAATRPQGLDENNIDMIDADSDAEIHTLEQQMNVQFKNVSLLRQALTHASTVVDNTDSNQRLEFLGDAVLEMIISSHLYERFPEYNEGQLTSLRKEVVNTKALAKLARQQELGRWIHMAKAEEATGGRNKPNILADVVESIIAAVYLDQGVAAAQEFILHWFHDLLQSAAITPSGTDEKTKLQELSRRLGLAMPQYFVTQKGPAHNLRFTASVLCNNKRLGWGVGKTKKAAEQSAAGYAIVVLEEKSPIELLVYASTSEHS